ncbi:hypothetical protein NC653_001696 [Populus alba x Populus x berolinensis]|uniref:Uncharacterized protein n=1 Tax=Populus alba x Populus x berolinensis TaxID=444605 RepID=A0AAD6RLV2_9ROSI|nr:hypothetical protein NC653_001696 [Populus alba x Populus x berolinensis]
MQNQVKNSKIKKFGQTLLKWVKLGKLGPSLPSLTKLTKIIHSKIASSTAKSLSATPSPPRPAGPGHTAPLLEPTPRATSQLRAIGTVSHMQSQQIEDPTNGESEEFDETRETLQLIRVLYRLGLAEHLRGRNGDHVAGFDRANAITKHLEVVGQESLDFSCTTMVLGKTCGGKSTNINSIFDEVKL